MNVSRSSAGLSVTQVALGDLRHFIMAELFLQKSWDIVEVK